MEMKSVASLPHDADKLKELFDELYSTIPQLPMDTSKASETLYGILKSDSNATRFCSFAEQHPSLAGLLQDLSAGEHTLFVPSDASWDNDPDTLQRMQADKSFAEQVLSMHISPHYITTESIAAIMPNVPMILRPEQSNGPQIIRARGSPAGWDLNESVHLVSGNVAAKNGVMHHIDGLLVPPPDALKTLEINSEFRLLRRAIEVSGFDAVIASADIHGQTLFAPTDAAFESLGQDTLDFLLDTEAGKPYLKALLQLHFCPNITVFSTFVWPKNDTGGRMRSADPIKKIKGTTSVTAPTSLVEKSGDRVSVLVSFARCNTLISMLVNGTAKVVRQNLTTSNGTIHAVDSVLLPGEGEDNETVGIEGFKRRFASFVE